MQMQSSLATSAVSEDGGCLDLYLSSPRKARAPAERASEARAFNELSRYHIRPSQFNRGLENVHFGKTHFRDLNIDARIV